jgi:hypothetical protein
MQNAAAQNGIEDYSKARIIAHRLRLRPAYACPATISSSGLLRKWRDKMKRMDFFAGQGARRRDSSDYGNDE